MRQSASNPSSGIEPVMTLHLTSPFSDDEDPNGDRRDVKAPTSLHIPRQRELDLIVSGWLGVHRDRIPAKSIRRT
jgi:hypothetical protein